VDYPETGTPLLPELLELMNIVERLGDRARVTEVALARRGDLTFPIFALVIGPPDRTLPTLGLFGGVHGLERIGTRVVLAYLRTLAELLQWDSHTQRLLSETRLVCIPIVNPIGMYLRRRANGNGVDLMRNAPVEADGVGAFHLHAGHRWSPRLPWYRGGKDQPMEVEAQALLRFVREEIFAARASITVDVHSGYGTRDRLWFPYARTRAPFPQAPEVLSLKTLLDQAYPNHVYCIEPQSLHYMSHGDLWDYLYDERIRGGNPGVFLPFCLELGSWIWLKKSARQFFSLLGVFNPIARHRLQRALRRHIPLFDFLLRAVGSYHAWAALSDGRRDELVRQADTLWYER
jgi:hypothetical protein